MAKRPEGAPIAVLRPPLLKPMAVIAHEIAEAADCGIPRMLDEARIAQGQRVVFRERPGVETVQQHQRARIVVDAITVGAIGHDADAMLQDRSEEHTSEPQSLMSISYAVFCLTK